MIPAVKRSPPGRHLSAAQIRLLALVVEASKAGGGLGFEHWRSHTRTHWRLQDLGLVRMHTDRRRGGLTHTVLVATPRGNELWGAMVAFAEHGPASRHSSRFGDPLPDALPDIPLIGVDVGVAPKRTVEEEK